MVFVRVLLGNTTRRRGASPFENRNLKLTSNTRKVSTRDFDELAYSIERYSRNDFHPRSVNTLLTQARSLSLSPKELITRDTHRYHQRPIRFVQIAGTNSIHRLTLNGKTQRGVTQQLGNSISKKSSEREFPRARQYISRK